MGLHPLDQSVRTYFASSLAPATISSYRSAANRYLAFCTTYSLVPLPLQEGTLARFVAFLADRGLAYPSIRAYLSGLRFLQLAQGLPDPALSTFVGLDYVLRGVHRMSTNLPRPKRLPITPSVLCVLLQVWSALPVSHDKIMLWAACCLGFFGFLRSGEFTCPSLAGFQSTMLTPADLRWDSCSNPSFISVHLRHSKTDTFGHGVLLYLGRTNTPLCPVAALSSYMALRGQSVGPLFLFQDGSTLSRQRLVLEVRKALSCTTLDTSRFNGHSFRIGAATTASENGFEDSLIQTLGRWRSSAFTTYINTPTSTLLSISSRLLGGAQ